MLALFSLQSKFPKLSSQEISETPKIFDGFLTLQGKDYYIHIETPNFPYAEDIVLKPGIELSEIIISSKFKNIKGKDDCTVLEYLKLLQETCEKFMKENESSKFFNFDTKEYEHLSLLLCHIEELGWDKISHVAPDFSSVHLQYRDDKQRLHNIVVQTTSTYSVHPLTYEADIPTEVTFISTHKTLAAIFNHWKTCVISLQPFWDVLDELDETALVIDPSSPGRKHTKRRILLENQVSLHLTVSPDHPFTAPKIQLLGPFSLVSPLSDRLLDLYQVWDESESIVYNVERFLKQRVVKRSSVSSGSDVIFDELNVECVVCYALHLNDQLPDCTCDCCRKSFHIQCLYDWLRSLPSSRQSRQYILGDCPYCTKPISCQVPE